MERGTVQHIESRLTVKIPALEPDTSHQMSQRKHFFDTSLVAEKHPKEISPECDTSREARP